MHQVEIMGANLDEATRWCREQHREAEATGSDLQWDFCIISQTRKSYRNFPSLEDTTFVFGFLQAENAFAFKMRFG